MLLNEIVDYASKIGVTLHAYISQEKMYIHLEYIGRYYKNDNIERDAPKGYGKYVLQKLCDLADEMQYNIVLQCAPTDRRCLAGHLHKYYEGFGFIDCKNPIFTCTQGTWMKRFPLTISHN